MTSADSGQARARRNRRARHTTALAAAVLVLAGACTISRESTNSAMVLPEGATTPQGPASGPTTAGGGSSGGSPPAPGDGTPVDAAPDGAPQPAAPTEAPGEVEGSAVAPAGAAPDGAGASESGTGDIPPAAPAPAEPAAETDAGGGTDDGGAAPDVTTDTAAAGATGEPTFDERSKVSTVGIGSVYFGMSPDEAADRAGAVWAGVPPGGADCYVVTPAGGPAGVALWVYHGAVERVDIENPVLRTSSGLGVGSTVGELLERLGTKLQISEHPAGWQQATFVPSDENDAAFRIVFDLTAGEVIRYRSGRAEIISRESCE